MKKVVWTETRVEGGRPFTGTLPKPPAVAGAFQTIVGARGGFGGGPAPAEPPEFYADSAVVAWPASRRDVPMAELRPVVSASGGGFSLAALTDGDFAKGTALPAAPLNRFSPEGELLESYPVPVAAPTMPCFGGPGLTRLFVTSLRVGRAPELLERYPLTGFVIAADVPVAGSPVSRFRDV